MSYLKPKNENHLIRTRKKPKAFLLPNPDDAAMEITIKRSGPCYVMVMAPWGIDDSFTFTLSCDLQSVTVFNKKGQWWIK